MSSVNPLETFEHIVVLMLENRSFDNMLGYLYPASQNNFNGVDGKHLSNPVPSYAGDGDVPVSKNPGTDASMWHPNPDPGEEYPHINTQLFSTVKPESNQFKKVDEMELPFNAPDPVPDRAKMNGFVTDYINTYAANNGGSLPDRDTYAQIMQCFTPDQNTGVPVISGLAKNFAVCNQWHCAVPSQTFCNRSFFNAATSNGYVVNSPYVNWVLCNDNETIFERLEAKGKTWKIYYDPQDFVSLTWLIHYPRLKRYTMSGKITTMCQFWDDVQQGNLPSYAFVEPRLFLNHNDQHPPVVVFDQTQPSSVLAGEVLINEVYDAIRTSSTQGDGKSNYTNTLLQITYDEHGGCYDHVSPPCAMPPHGNVPGQMGFPFNRLGVRVPSLFISNYIPAPPAIVNTRLQHTSMIKTMSNKWGLGCLTDRDESATDISSVFGTNPVERTDPWPQFTPRPFSGYGILTDQQIQETFNNRDNPLNDLQRAIVGMANIAKHGEDAPSIDQFATVGEALVILEKLSGDR